MQRPSRALIIVAALGCATRLPRSDTPPSTTVDLYVAATTDVHGRLRGWDYFTDAADSARGLARLATAVDSLRAAAPDRVVLVDAGDFLQGNPLTYVAARVSRDSAHPVIAAMNAMRYDAAAIGNHEFNYGLSTLDRAISQAKFPLLAANAYAPSGTLAYPASTIVERAGVRVGIVGATTPGSMLWDRDNLRGRLTVRDIVPAVRDAVARVRSEGAAVVVVVLHSGLEEPASYDTVATRLPSENVAARVAREVDGIDLVVFGHSHREVADTTIGTVMLVQPKNWATSLAVARLTVERGGGRTRVVARRGVLVGATGHAESERVLTATRAAHEQTLAYVTAPIGATPVAWRADSARVRDTPLIDFVLEVQRKAAGAQLSSTAAFALDATLGPGAVTIAQLARLYPYENTLKAVRLTGRQLRDYLERSARYFGTAGTAEPAVDPRVPGYNYDIVAGVTYTLDLSRPVGSRVTRLEIAGRAVREDEQFTMALNNYRASGGGGFAMLRDAAVVFEQPIDIRQLLIDEVRAEGTIRPEEYFARNWEIVPAAAAAAAYEAMHKGRVSPRAAASHARSRARRLRIIATNDFHGALDSRADARGVMRGGAARLATAVERAAAECRDDCAWLLLDGGDMFQGTPASNLAFGRPVVALYNLLGYTAAALGNHEFDWGQDTLRARIREARFAILGANVRYEDGRDVPWIRDDTLVERGGLRIGIVGVASPRTPGDTRRSNVQGLRFDDPAPIIDARARELRARGADAIVVVAHDGAFCERDGRTSACAGEIVDLAQRLTERVDAIVSGHTHSRVATLVNGIPIVQARSSGSAIGVTDIAIRGDSAASRAPVVVDVLADSLPPSPAVDSLVRRALAAVAPVVNRRVAEIADAMPRRGSQYALGNLVTDAQRWAGRADVALTNNTGIRADLRAGSATYGALFEIQPFGNALVRLTVRGAALEAFLEALLGAGDPRIHVSGVTIRFDSSRAAGSRLETVRLADGRTVTDSGTYTIVLNDFLASDGPGKRLAEIAVKRETLAVNDLEALVGYIRSRPQPVAPPRESRIIAVACPTPSQCS